MKRRLVCGALLAVACVPSASAAAPPEWKVHKKISSELFLDDVETVGKNDTWFFGTEVGGPTDVVAFHWNGKAIRKVPVPADLQFSPIDVDFASADDGWAVGTDLGWTVYVAHWDGTAWKVVKREPVTETWPQVKALGGGKALVTGSVNADGVDVNWTFDGKAWTTAKDRLRLLEFSGDHALNSTSGIRRLSRWNPKTETWKRLEVRGIPKPLGKRHVMLEFLEAPSAREIWLTARQETGRDTGRTYLLHWNGERWKRERVPFPNAHTGAYQLAADGRGGVWLAAHTAALYEYEAQGDHVLYHRHPSGEWERLKTDRVLKDLARVPGTPSLWAVGFHGCCVDAIYTHDRPR